MTYSKQILLLDLPPVKSIDKDYVVGSFTIYCFSIVITGGGFIFPILRQDIMQISKLDLV